MKKLVLLAGVLALAAGCQKTELPEAPKNEQNGGLTIEASLGDATTKGYYYNNGLKMGWNAETDQIGLFYKNLTTKRTNEAVATPAVWNNWETMNYGTAPEAAYKATTTGSRGFFTAAAKEDILQWHKNAEGAIVAGEIAAYYPKTESVTSISADPATGFEVVMPNIAAQTMKDIKGTDATQYDFMTARAENILPKMENNVVGSVGETILGGEAKLTFKSHMVVLKLQMKNVKPEFGKLKSITLTAAGDDGQGNNASVIAYTDNNGKWKFAGAKTEVDGKMIYDDKMSTDLSSNGASEIALTMKDAGGFKWDDENAYAYITTLPVTRSENFDAETPEIITIAYDFEFMDYTAEIETANDWNAGESIEVPVMDFDKIDAYVVTPSANNHYLYLNEGLGEIKLSSLFDKTVSPTGVEIGANTYVFAEIKGLHSTNTELDLDGLEKLTALTDLTIANGAITTAQVAGSKAALKNIDLGANVTSIPTGFFANMGELLSLKGAGVTTIAEDALAAGTTYKIAEVILPKYKFESKVVREKMLVKTALTKVDFSSVSAIGVVFTETVPALSGYTALTDVVLNPNGVAIGLSAFDGCTSLATIENLDKIQVPEGADAIGNYAFRKTKVDKITVPGTRIPVGAFSDCADLADVKFAGVVTAIGEEAFKSCAKLKGVDLSNVTTIGASAFETAATDASVTNFVVNLDKVTTLGKNAFNGCSKLLGDNLGTLEVKQVQYIPEGAFQNIGAKYIVLHAATKLGLNSLNANFNQIRIVPVFDVDVNIADPGAGKGVAAFKSDVTAVGLFVNNAQPGVVANALTLHETKYTFNSIVKE